MDGETLTEAESLPSSKVPVHGAFLACRRAVSPSCRPKDLPVLCKSSINNIWDTQYINTFYNLLASAPILLKHHKGPRNRCWRIGLNTLGDARLFNRTSLFGPPTLPQSKAMTEGRISYQLLHTRLRICPNLTGCPDVCPEAKWLCLGWPRFRQISPAAVFLYPRRPWPATTGAQSLPGDSRDRSDHLENKLP